MTQHFNKLPPKVQELLVMLGEEANEVGKAVSKALRHGLDSMHPDKLPHVTGNWEDPPPDNRRDIAKECGDLIGVLSRLIELGVLDGAIVDQARQTKMERSRPYLHHQEDSK